jgi:hypothetical protein
MPGNPYGGVLYFGLGDHASAYVVNVVSCTAGAVRGTPPATGLQVHPHRPACAESGALLRNLSKATSFS